MMAGTIQQLWSTGLVEEKEHHQHEPKRCGRSSLDLLWDDEYCKGPSLSRTRESPTCPPPVKHKNSLWIHGMYKQPSRVCQETPTRVATMSTQAQYEELSDGTSLLCHDHFVALLRACAKGKDLHTGMRIHNALLKRGLLTRCSDALVAMYAKCGALEEAKKLLDMHKSKFVFSWTALIAAYVQQGQNHEALNCFEQMQCEGLSPDAVTFVCILKACGNMKAAEKGKQIHDAMAAQGLPGNDVVLGTALVDMYAKCGALAKAQRVLDELPSRDAISWNLLIAGYTQEGQGENALSCLEHMQREGLSPNAMTFACILKACGTIGAIDKGGQIHDEIMRQGLLGNDVVLGTALVDMYVKCGALAKAHHALEELPLRNVVSWCALITGYSEEGQGEQALKCFERMQCEGISPNSVTFASILKACATTGAIDKGEQIHDEIAKQGLLPNDTVLGTALVDMYAKCGSLEKAQRVLEGLRSRNVVSWNSLIAGYAQKGQGEQALNCFEQMQREGLSPDEVTFTCVLKACGTIAAVDKGELIHDEIVRQGLLEKDVVLGTALVDMYVQCGALAKARRVLEKLPSRNVVSWCTLISGYAQQGQGEQALNCFERMQCEGLSPNEVTFACILKACGAIGAVERGEQIHDEIVRLGILRNDIVLGNALVDMYAKCGALEKAQRVLEELPSRNVVSWNALITGYAQQGQGEQALNCFERMQCDGFSPDAVTFSCVLSVCNHLGLVEDGYMHFVNMSTKYGVKPELEHYTCMVDLFGRAGHLEKAVKVIQEMPSCDHSAVWCALLGACRKWGDVVVGRWAFEEAVKVDKSDGASYVLMASIYSGAGMQEEAKSIEAMGIEYRAEHKKESREGTRVLFMTTS